MGKASAGGTPSSWVGVLGEEDELSNGSESHTGRIAETLLRKKNLSIK